MVLILATVNGQEYASKESQDKSVEGTEECLVIELFFVDGDGANSQHWQCVDG